MLNEGVHTSGSRHGSGGGHADHDGVDVRTRLHGRRRRAWRGRRRRRAPLLAFFAILLAFLAAGAGGVAAMLVRGPVPFDWLGPRIAAALDARLGPDYEISIGRTTLSARGLSPVVAVADLKVASRDGRPVFAAPHALVFLDPMSLAVGAVSPRRIELADLDLHLVLTDDGAVGLAAGAAEPILFRAPPPPAVEAGPETSVVGEHAAMRPVADAIGLVLSLSLGQQSPLGGLEHVGITRGRLVFEDRSAGRSVVYDGLELVVERDAQRADLSVSANGPNGRWMLAAQASGAPGAGGALRGLDIAVRDLSADEVSLLFGLRDPFFDFDTPVSARLHLGLDDAGRLETAAGRFVAGSGFIYYLKDPAYEPTRVDSIAGAFAWDAAARRFELGPVTYQSGRTHLTFSGRVNPPDRADPRWRLEMSGGAGAFGALAPGEEDVTVERSQIEADIDPMAETFALRSLTLRGPSLDLRMAGEGSWRSGDRTVGLRIDVAQTSAAAVLRLWPSPVAPYTRAWFLAHKTGGLVEAGKAILDLDEDGVIAIARGQAVAEQAVQIDFQLRDATLAFLPGVPPLTGLAGAGRVTGRNASFSASAGVIDLAPDRRVTLADGRFESFDFAGPVVQGSVSARATGSIEAVGDLLSREGLREYGGFAMEAGAIRGQVDARVNVGMQFWPPKDAVSVQVAAQVSNMTIDRLVGRERFDQGTLAVTADASGMRAVGQGRLFGAPARIEMRKPPGGVTEATLTMQLDDAARERQGWATQGVTGPVNARVRSALGAGDRIRPQVELDLTRAAIAGIAPGYAKPAGRPARASFTLAQDGQQTSLQSFVYDAGAAYAQGVIELDASGGLAQANLSQVRISPGDDMKVEASQGRDGLRVVVRATTIDARPFVQELLLGAAGGGGGQAQERPASTGVALDVRSDLVTGANGQALSAFELRAATRGDALREFRLAARAGRAAVSGGQLPPQPGSPNQFFIRSEDGGAALSFLDLYRRMEGGQLQLVGYGSARGSAGVLSVRNFILRDESTIERLVAEGAPQMDAARAGIDPNAVAFERLQVSFSRGAGRLELRDGVVSGPVIGATIEGTIDFGRDAVALNGTFVPAYGINNLFSKIPLFGPLLGGGANEGLIGINYRISGSAAAPMLTINPLSAMTPGFLRRIFGATDALTAPRPPEAAPVR